MSGGDIQASRDAQNARLVSNALYALCTELTGEEIPRLDRSEPLSINNAMVIIFGKSANVNPEEKLRLLQEGNEDEWLRVLMMAKGDWVFNDLKKVSPFANKLIVIVRESSHQGSGKYLGASLYDLDALIAEHGFTLGNFPNKEKRVISTEIVFIRADSTW